MKKTIFTDGDDGVSLIVKRSGKSFVRQEREPVHVVYGGAHLFTAATPKKLGIIALETTKTFAPNFAEFAYAMGIPELSSFPRLPKAVAKLDVQIRKNPQQARARDFASWLAWSVYERTIAKLKAEPVEDFRIDFEDGYGVRGDAEEDRDAVNAASELARIAASDEPLPFCGIRIKALDKATRDRAERTLRLFLETLLRDGGAKLPANFCVTLPKVTHRKQVKRLGRLLDRFERENRIADNSIGLEVMIETPLAIFDGNGRVPLRSFAKAVGTRPFSAHLGAFDYTAELGIATPFQGVGHASCEFARQIMLANMAPLGIRLSDSVTTVLPIAKKNGTEDRRLIYNGWRLHFANVSRSIASGFYQSWDLHPNQLPARYAAIYAFFIANCDAQAARLKRFIECDAQATLSGTAFDDAASVNGLLNFFRRAASCGALTSDEIESATGLSIGEISVLEFGEDHVSEQLTHRRPT